MRAASVTVRLPVQRGPERCVYCPRQRGLVPLAECQLCPRCECIASDLHGEMEVVCRLCRDLPFTGRLVGRSLLEDE